MYGLEKQIGRVASFFLSVAARMNYSISEIEVAVVCPLTCAQILLLHQSR